MIVYHTDPKPDDPHQLELFSFGAMGCGEKWEAINWLEGIEGVFEVSSEGRVRNKITGNIMSQHSASGHSKGYSLVGLRWDNIRYTKLTHRLVAKAFCYRPDSGARIVNHKDNNPANNCADNLEWVTHAENSRHYHQKIKR